MGLSEVCSLILGKQAEIRNCVKRALDNRDCPELRIMSTMLKSGADFSQIRDRLAGCGKALKYSLSYETTLPLVKPRAISIDIGRHCNLRCRICSQWKDNNDNRKLELDDVKGIIDQIHSFCPEAILEFSGQEPLMQKELLFQSLEYATGKGLTLALNTNGTLIGPATARRLVQYRFNHITVSLDAADPGIHDYMRNQDGAHKKAISALKHLLKSRGDSRIAIAVTAVITNINLDELLKLHRLAAGMGVDCLNYNAYTLDNSYFFNADATYEDEFWVTDDNQEKLKAIVDQLMRLKGKPQITNSRAQLKAIPGYFRDKQNFKKGACLAGYNYFHITNFGEVTVCGKGPHINLRKHTISMIWDSNEMRKTRLATQACGKPCLNNCFDLL
ncbi:MAG: radical SAM protein [archaeon]